MIRGEARIWGLKERFDDENIVVSENLEYLGYIYQPFFGVPPDKFAKLLDQDKRFRYEVTSDGYIDIHTLSVSLTKKGLDESRHPFEIFRETVKELPRYMEVKKKRLLRFHIAAGHFRAFFLTRIGLVPYIGLVNKRTYVGDMVVDLFPLLKIVADFFWGEYGMELYIGISEAMDPRLFTKMPVKTFSGETIQGFIFPNVDLQKHGVFSWIDTWFYSRPGYENGVAKLFIYQDDNGEEIGKGIETFVAPPFLKKEAYLKIGGLGEWTIIMKPGYTLETEIYSEPPRRGGVSFWF